ncbi:pirin-like C-terminal cupin domain-containing protein [Pontibacter sp. CAU 1760]
MSSIELTATGKWEAEVPEAHNIFFYVVRGKVKVNGQEVSKLHLVEFEHDHRLVQVEALEDAYLLFGHALPFNEPVVSHGPFVMNTEQEIQQAFQDYQSGKMGKW